MPTRARRRGRSVVGSVSDVPATTTSPFWNGSSALTHLISVDFPDPDGPQTTTTSPLSTRVVHSLSTWNVPYHLLRLRISIIGSLTARYRTMATRACSVFTACESE